MSEVLSQTDAKELLRLCKAGRLFDVQNWIASGKSLCVPSDLRTTPLKVALDTGFHSLVEVLAQNEQNQELRNRALLHSVSLKRLDFIQLLVSHGADLRSVPFIEVLRIWEPNIIRFFLDHGADCIQGSPFAVAFGERIRTAIGAWRECREKYSEVAAQLQEQADRALRHFCEKEDLKWVSLLMWAGADPRSSGPTLDDDDEDLDDSEQSTAFAAAAYAKNLQILKRLKPEVEQDDVDKLLTKATAFGRVDVVRYLLELGAKPNDKLNGGSAALDRCLSTSLRCESFRITSHWHGSSSKASTYSVSQTLDTFALLLDRGALLRPDNDKELAWVRRSLYECEFYVTLKVVEGLVKRAACTQETIHNLLRTPAMKKHLAPVARKLVSLGFDVRTPEQKCEDKRQQEESSKWAASPCVKIQSRADQ